MSASFGRVFDQPSFQYYARKYVRTLYERTTYVRMYVRTYVHTTYVRLLYARTYVLPITENVDVRTHVYLNPATAGGLATGGLAPYDTQESGRRGGFESGESV